MESERAASRRSFDVVTRVEKEANPLGEGAERVESARETSW